MTPVLVFDVNETLLDVSALAPHFERAFGDPAVLGQWFGQLLRSTYVLTLSGRYHDFGTIGRHALDLVAHRHQIALSAGARAAIAEGMLALPPHPEVKESLARLQAAGFRLATLTNSAPQAMQQQLSNAGLLHFFEQTFSVEPTRRFKPAPEPYRMAAAGLGVPTGEMRMIAAHNWDTSGAIRAGCLAAFVARPGMSLGPLDEQPDIVGNDLMEVAEKIVA